MDDLAEPVFGSKAFGHIMQSLTEIGGEPLRHKVIAEAGLPYLKTDQNRPSFSPTAILSLFQILERVLPKALASRVVILSARKAAEDLLKEHIPGIAQKMLYTLPDHVSAPLLLDALKRIAWTFAGSGSVRVMAGPPMYLVIDKNPAVIWGCLWQRALIETVFRNLISARARVEHLRCCKTGQSSCIYVIEI